MSEIIGKVGSSKKIWSDEKLDHPRKKKEMMT